MEIISILALIPLERYMADFALNSGDKIIMTSNSAPVSYWFHSILNANQILVRYSSEVTRHTILERTMGNLYVEVAVIRKIDLPQQYTEQLKMFEE